MWLIQVAVVVLVCNGCGAIAELMGQCKVIGEIVGGILLGPLALHDFTAFRFKLGGLAFLASRHWTLQLPHDIPYFRPADKPPQ
ncbi:hypothetical protein [Burkholderia catarinensis]|uniref:hypothetical protein n=1 Tax=Burkholderia catarinensis TaxID=1108140 RepID=UPI001FEB183C|nr:hypothetical protein [Burkholderia catarinensis]